MHREFLARLKFGQAAQVAGIRIQAVTAHDRDRLAALFDRLGLADVAQIATVSHGELHVRLAPAAADALLPRHDTLTLPERLPRGASSVLERETVTALLGAPLPFVYASLAEFEAAVCIRLNIVEAAARTQLAFDAHAAERPWDWWDYDEDRGFTVKPGKSLIEALRRATQPQDPAQKYEFSCYRATEYVLLLAIAQELAAHNPPLHARLQAQWESKAIKSGQFHEVFLDEFGSLERPLPPGYYIPGDRVWFRNPDEASADIPGYEGSWVFYLGGGLFSNFWRADQAFTLGRKCLEIYHWRHGIGPGESPGELRMDEDRVEACVQESLSHPAEVRRILERMLRLRDGRGVYAEGGCIDASRECVRPVCPGSADIRLPPQ